MRSHKSLKINFLILLFLVKISVGLSQIRGLDTSLYVYGEPLYNKKIVGDFIKVDSLVEIIPAKHTKNSASLVEYCNTFCTNDYEKVRAFYTFIGNQITYDSEKGKNRKKITRQLSAKETLSSKKGVCGDVAVLFKDLCKTANIPCEYVVGYTKKPYQFWKPKRKDLDHAWNVVKIDSTWYLIDVTWGMRKFTDQRKNIPEVNYLFFLSHPYLFIQNHLPADPNYQLMDYPFSFSFFKWQRFSSRKNRLYNNSKMDFNGNLNARLNLKWEDAILQGAIDAYHFNPKNKFIVGAILLWYVDEVTDVKKQNKKKLDVQDYKLALKILNEAKNQVAIIEDKKTDGFVRYIDKQISELDKKRARLEKKKS